MSTLGIVVAKAQSKRFKNKNLYEINEHPMFWHSVMPLLESRLVNDVVVATNSLKIKEYCEKKGGVNIVWRAKNASESEEPLLKVLNYVYKSLDKKYDKIICILANAPGHTSKCVDKAIKLMEKHNLKEVRSFDVNSLENGLLLFKECVILENNNISTYLGSVVNDVKEIHYKSDLK